MEINPLFSVSIIHVRTSSLSPRCLPTFLSERELFMFHSIELQSLYSCDLGFYQIDQRVLVWLTFPVLTASPPLCQGSQNSHMLVSKATNRDLSPGRVDRRWMKEHESVAALANCLYFLLNCSSRKIKCAQHRVRKWHNNTNFSVTLFSL